MTGKKQNRKKDRNLGLVAGTACVALAAWQYMNTHVLYGWMLSAGILLLLVAVFVPILLLPARSVLEITGRWMGVANTYILLTLIYILFFIPVNLFFKLSGKDSLRLQQDKSATSYWVESPVQEESSMKNQY